MVLPLLFAVASSPLICVPVPPLVMSALAFVIDDGLVAVNLDTHGLRIGDGHGALVIHRRAVAGDINTVTAAADIQIAVLNHFPVITVDFRTGGIFTVNGGFAIVVYCGIITRNNKLTVVIILPLRCAICAHPSRATVLFASSICQRLIVALRPLLSCRDIVPSAFSV